MNDNATQSADTGAQHDRAIDSHGDFRVTKPAWMDANRWAEIIDKTTDKLDELVDLARPAEPAPTEGPCTERTWCVMTDPDEHASYHSSHPVPLFDRDMEKDLGWSAHIYEDRGERPHVFLEGVVDESDRGRTVYTADITVGSAVALLWATTTAKSNHDLLQLLALTDAVVVGTPERRS